MNQMVSVILLLFVANVSGFNVVRFSSTPKKVSLFEHEYVLDTWDDGEVSWEIEPFYPKLNDTTKTPEPIENNREKIWGLIEEIRMQGIISGFLNVAYYNTELAENIIDNLQTFDVSKNNNELDIFYIFAAIVGYKKYNESKILVFINRWETNYKSNYYIDEFKKKQRFATTFSLMMLLIFFKSVKNAI